MKKFALLCLILVNPCYPETASEIYYKFCLHVTHSEQYSHQKWKGCESLISSLIKQCESTKDDTSAQAFNASQQEAIATIKKICALCINEPSLQTAIDISSTTLQMPQKGLLILLEYHIAQTTPEENKIKIDNLIKNLQENNTYEKREILLGNLSHLETIFNLSSGESRLLVRNFENNAS